MEKSCFCSPSNITILKNSYFVDTSVCLVLGAMRNMVLLITARNITVKHYFLESRKELLLSNAQTHKDILLTLLFKHMSRFKSRLFDKLFQSVLNLLRSLSDLRRHAMCAVCAAHPGK